MHDNPIILLFMKAPVLGRVKSRLAEAVGEEAALDLYKRFVLDTLDMVTSVDVPLRICFDPSAGENAVSSWLGPGYELRPQQGGDLGQRMERAFAEAFAEGFGRAVLLGTDIPDLPRTVAAEAISALQDRDAVIGPSTDGGYYLVGFTATGFFPPAFLGIPWSTDRVLRDTLRILGEASVRVHLTPTWTDVDDLGGLRALLARAEGSGSRGSRTIEYLVHNRERLFPGEPLWTRNRS